MIEELATVTAVRNGKIQVETQIKTTCGGCQANDHCGTGIVAKAMSPKMQRLQLDCSLPVEQGQQVVVGIPEQTLLLASLLVYLVPVLMLVVAAILLPLAGLPEGLVVLFSLSFAAISWLLVKRWLATRDTQFEPTLIKVQPKTIDVLNITS
ncbi:SoxR reducing system RseC family protein [Neptunicella marina]|uniref:SoxR reducing system RseC family protein n=1 Tax=Neptunicella marina TaxID=2125989 RepID=A0A8J6LZY4_9ALTE|nr:SoxR reducing system RseC family protein [Neptunicella marina]